MKWNVLAAFAVLLIAAFAPMNPASTWVAANADQATGAPAAYAGPDQLVNARRAAGDAGAQAGFLTQGTQQLRDGTEQLKGGSEDLASGVKAAHDGAQQLSAGMVELQAGTGQLADGATRLADSVGGAVDKVTGFEAVRGQILSAIDDALNATKNSRDPQVADVRNQLHSLRSQVETAQIPGDFSNQLNELKNGSRELSNQLSVPGYAYHDGMYAATNGAKELADGLGEMNGKVGEAGEGINQLVDGTVKIDDMADKTKADIEAVQRALPAAAPVAGSTDPIAPSSALPPLAAMLVAALAVLGGAATALQAYTAKNRWFVIGTGTAFTSLAGLILVGILGTSLSPAAFGVAGLALVLGTLASAGITWVLRGAFGRTGGTIAAGVFVLLQVGVVGWLWSTAATGETTLLWRSASSALPMHWVTTAISAAGNEGSLAALWTAIAFSALLAGIGIFAVAREDAPRSGGDSADEAGNAARATAQPTVREYEYVEEDENYEDLQDLEMAGSTRVISRASVPHTPSAGGADTTEFKAVDK